MTDLMGWMVQNTLAVAVLVVFVLLACRLFPYRPALQHALWVLVLIKFMTPPIIVWPYSLADIGDRVVQLTLSPLQNRSALSAARQNANARSANVRSPATRSERARAKLQSTWSLQDESRSPVASARWAVQGVLSTPLFLATVSGAWLLGGLVSLVLQARRIAWQLALLRRGRPAPRGVVDEIEHVANALKMRPVPAWVVPAIHSPFVWCLGWRRLVWPASLTSGQALRRSRGVIAHELAHLRRRDHWIAWLELVASLIWWWNPLFWFVRHRLRQAAEMACDAVALGVHEDRREYAEMFLELSSSFKTGAPAPVLGVSTGTPSSFERRLSMILSDRVSGKLSLGGLLLVGGLTAVTLPTLSLAQGSSHDDRNVQENPPVQTAPQADTDGYLEEIEFAVAEDEDLEIFVAGSEAPGNEAQVTFHLATDDANKSQNVLRVAESFLDNVARDAVLTADGTGPLSIDLVRVSDDDRAALVLTDAVVLTKRDRDGIDKGRLVLRLVNKDGRWLVQSINFESDQEAIKAIEARVSKDSGKPTALPQATPARASRFRNLAVHPSNPRLAFQPEPSPASSTETRELERQLLALDVETAELKLDAEQNKLQRMKMDHQELSDEPSKARDYRDQQLRVKLLQIEHRRAQLRLKLFERERRDTSVRSIRPR